MLCERKLVCNKPIFCAFSLTVVSDKSCLLNLYEVIRILLSTILRRRNPVKWLSLRHKAFPTAQQVNLPTCSTVPLMLNVKQVSCEYQFSSHWFDPTRNGTRVYRSRGRPTLGRRFYPTASSERYTTLKQQ